MTNRQRVATLVLLSGFAGWSLSVAAMAGDTSPAPETKAGKDLYICLDNANPCLSSAADGCKDCAKPVKKVPYDLHHHMEVVGQAAKLLQKDIKSSAFDKMKGRTDMIMLVAGRIGEFDPPGATSDKAKYNAFADELKTTAGQVAKDAEAKDVDALKKAYSAMNKTCNGCHQLYRE